MHVVLVFLLPAFFFMGVGAFIHMFAQGVKSGIYQRLRHQRRGSNG